MTFDERLERLERVRAGISRSLVRGEIDGFGLLELNQKVDEFERRYKAMRLALILSRKDVKR